MGALRYNIALAVANILFGVSFSVYVSLLHGELHYEQLFAMQLLFSMVQNKKKFKNCLLKMVFQKMVRCNYTMEEQVFHLKIKQTLV